LLKIKLKKLETPQIMSTCLIEEQLLRAEASAGSKDELTSLLALFKIIVSK